MTCQESKKAGNAHWYLYKVVYKTDYNRLKSLRDDSYGALAFILLSFFVCPATVRFTHDGSGMTVRQCYSIVFKHWSPITIDVEGE